ncbi:dihydropteroate synthase [Bermanella marisrubri]|uniref:Dihydropteroate synthase n=1 Tax=Bermanella marisrubri TaxID=207949 RepID=Q1MZR6_9GAMM|nr:dihydropteroate synthase [Bermanella marisrubri]EAT11491.1 dihydropteroate synthase [Oceanobacter sp. RED65] [Bermanella marisrubri]
MKLQYGHQILDLSHPHIMGVLNVTPDSFSDGGQFNQLDSALAHAQQMQQQGASIIDVGGESTRPGAEPVSVQEELDRVIPVVTKLANNMDVCISVDTSTPQVMREAAQAGAHFINDVRALTREGAMQAAKDTGLPICLMHMQGDPKSMQNNPEYAQVVNDVYDYLSERIEACLQFGIALDQLLIDPGFGFGKTLEHNYQLLAQLDRFLELKLPLLIGLSRKSMIGGVLDNRPPHERVSGSVAGALIAVMNGAQIVRVHDVQETSDALKVWQAAKQFA